MIGIAKMSAQNEEITEQIGINELSHFSLLFMKYVGLKPSEYRNKFR